MPKIYLFVQFLWSNDSHRYSPQFKIIVIMQSLPWARNIFDKHLKKECDEIHEYKWKIPFLYSWRINSELFFDRSNALHTAWNRYVHMVKITKMSHTPSHFRVVKSMKKSFFFTFDNWKIYSRWNHTKSPIKFSSDFDYYFTYIYIYIYHRECKADINK